MEHYERYHRKQVFEVFWKEMMAKIDRSLQTITGEELQQPESELKPNDIDVFIVNLWPRNEREKL